MKKSTDPLGLLRHQFKPFGIQGWLIGCGDWHLNEYVCPRDERLARITGFTGSAGYAVILKNKAAVFVDGRYTIQAKQEIDNKKFDIEPLSLDAISGWIKKNSKDEDLIGLDPWLHTKAWLDQLADKSNRKLHISDQNPIDLDWEGQPDYPKQKLLNWPEKFAGQNRKEKHDQIKSWLKENEFDAMITIKPDEICWLLNIRGQDIPFNPLILSSAIIWKDRKIDLFINMQSLNTSQKKSLQPLCRLYPYNDFKKQLKLIKEKNIAIDPKQIVVGVGYNLRGKKNNLRAMPSEITRLRSIKNKTEISGMKSCHVRDGVALVKFLHWLDQQKTTDEIAASDYLQSFRSKQKHYVSDSFDVISGFNANGAIVHYSATQKTNKKITGNGLYLIDSGGQYFDGTTDVTRTIAIGKPTKDMIQDYTYVLKAHLALQLHTFPSGANGAQLDGITRQSLWASGLDFQHGTGHGIGHFGCVHEGPIGIAKSYQAPLQIGMVLSNEPGLYRAGKYGIRIENACVIVPTKQKNFLTLESLTLVPYDRKLIDKKYLTKDEIDWINHYHMQVWTKLSKSLSSSEKSWLKAATKKL